MDFDCFKKILEMIEPDITPKLANNVAQSWPTFINMLINVGATF